MIHAAIEAGVGHSVQLQLLGADAVRAELCSRVAGVTLSRGTGLTSDGSGPSGSA